MESEAQGVRTSLYSILCIVIRLGAVMMALNTFGAAFGFYATGPRADFSTGESALVVMFLLAILLVSFLLWLYPGPLARLASARSAHLVIESPISAGQIQWVALSVLGMYWVMTAILDLAPIGYQFLVLPEMLGAGVEAAPYLREKVTYHFVELILGISLTLGARGLTGIVQKIRYAGMTAEEPEGTGDPSRDNVKRNND